MSSGPASRQLPKGVRRFLRTLVVAALIGLAATGCSGNDAADDGSAGASTTNGSGSTPSSSPATERPGNDATSTTLTEGTGEPVVRPAENPGDGSSPNWIGHGEMNSRSVELIWSVVAGEQVEYTVWRFPTGGGFDPDSVELDPAGAVYRGAGTDHLDTTIEPDTFYTYVLMVEADAVIMGRRWTEVLTSDDTTPPTPVSDLAAERTPEGVLVSWSPATEETEFGAYSVSVREPDGTMMYIGGGNELDQVSFLDTRAATGGSLTYVVEAVDFHDNRSEPQQVTVS